MTRFKRTKELPKANAPSIQTVEDDGYSSINTIKIPPNDPSGSNFPPIIFLKETDCYVSFVVAGHLLANEVFSNGIKAAP